jgi:hypothetical protein
VALTPDQGEGLIQGQVVGHIPGQGVVYILGRVVALTRARVVVHILAQAVVLLQAQVAVVTTALAAVAPINGTDPAHTANKWFEISGFESTSNPKLLKASTNERNYLPTLPYCF